MQYAKDDSSKSKSNYEGKLMNYTNENYITYPTISILSKCDRERHYVEEEGIERTEGNTYCFVCGKRLCGAKRCHNCGYDTSKNYEIRKTLNLIPEGRKSLIKCREEYLAKEKECEIKKAVTQAKELLEKEVEKQKAETSRQIAVNEKQKTEISKQKAEISRQKTEIGKQKTENSRQKSEIQNLQQQILTLQAENKKLKANTSQSKPASVIKETIPAKQNKRNLKVGDIIQFGAYPQAADGRKSPIEWKVLDIKNGKALLQSVYGLEAKPFNIKRKDITWEKCTSRSWLNKDFVNTAFNSQERSQIAEELVKAEKNPEYNTNPGNDTRDKVFLLSIREAEKYYSSNKERKCKPTPYAEENGADTIKYGNTKCSRWWLRSPGYISLDAACVDIDGSLYHYGNYVGLDDFVVRPALWINL